MITHRKDLKDIKVAGGIVRRRLVTIGREPAVLLNKSHPILRPRFSRSEWRKFSCTSVCDERTHDLVRHWNRFCRFSFNCHTLAIGSFVGMRPDSWLEGSSSIFTLMQNPTQTILDAFFEELDSAPSVKNMRCELEDDDVLVLAVRQSEDLVHSGRVRMIDARPMLVSKLGEHPVAASSVDAIVHEYRDQFDYVKLFRCCPNTAEHSDSFVAGERGTLVAERRQRIAWGERTEPQRGFV